MTGALNTVQDAEINFELLEDKMGFEDFLIFNMINKDKNKRNGENEDAGIFDDIFNEDKDEKDADF